MVVDLNCADGPMTWEEAAADAPLQDDSSTLLRIDERDMPRELAQFILLETDQTGAPVWIGEVTLNLSDIHVHPSHTLPDDWETLKWAFQADSVNSFGFVKLPGDTKLAYIAGRVL
ncbi:hypothetical protein [Streptomyces sp. NPDC007172]|uniref:hypothetical protein n=1 Tax=Streptomyces sp. NPDC007172 TaxID=3364776 RepID=UPI003682B0CA